AHGFAVFALLVIHGDGLARIHKLLPECWVGNFSRQNTAGIVNEFGGAAGDVYNLAHQIRIHTLDKIFQVQVDIIHGAGQFGGEVITQVFRIQVIEVGARINKGAARFTHLGAVNG